MSWLCLLSALLATLGHSATVEVTLMAAMVVLDPHVSDQPPVIGEYMEDATYDMEFPRATAAFNATIPGPTITVREGDTLVITLINALHDNDLLVHYHGLEMPGNNDADGVMATTCPLHVGQSKTFSFTVYPRGTHHYHGHRMQQALGGLLGPLIVLPPEGETDPFADMYEEEMVITVSERYVSALDTHTNFYTQPICAQFNGVCENYDLSYKTVVPGKCYRLRIIPSLFEVQESHFIIEGHNLTVIALDGFDVQPTEVEVIDLNPSVTVDAIFCARPETDRLYQVSWEPTDRQGITQGNVSSFYLVTEGYEDSINWDSLNPGMQFNETESHVLWNLNDGEPSKKWLPSSAIAQDFQALPEPEALKSLDMGMIDNWDLAFGNEFSGYNRWYYLTEYKEGVAPVPFIPPFVPLTQTAGEWGLSEQTTVLDLDCPSSDVCVYDIALNNLMRFSHTMHLHGMPFYVIGNMRWLNHTMDAWMTAYDELDIECTVRWGPAEFDDSWDIQQADAWQWGCVYDPDNEAQQAILNLDNPPKATSVTVDAHAWVLIRVVVENPGYWMLHCSVIDHQTRAQAMIINARSDEHQPLSTGTWDECLTDRESILIEAAVALAEEEASNVWSANLVASVVFNCLFMVSFCILGAFYVRLIRAEKMSRAGFRSLTATDGH